MNSLALYKIYKFLSYQHNLLFRVDFSMKLFKFLTLSKWNSFTKIMELMVLGGKHTPKTIPHIVFFL